MTSARKLLGAGGGAPASDFDPTEINWNQMWWAEGELFQATGPSDGVGVATWPDEMGDSDLTGDSAGRPLYVESTPALNNKPSFQLGVDAFFYNTDLTTDAVQPFTIVYVLEDEGPLTTVGVPVGMWEGQYYVRHGYESSGFQMNSGVTNQQFGFGEKRLGGGLFEAVFDEGESDFRYDGTSLIDTPIQPGGGTWTYFYVGQEGNDRSTWFPGKVAFVAIYPGDFKYDPSYYDFMSWVKSHYGIDVTLPPGGGEFDPLLNVNWQNLYWAGGPKMSALGYGDGAPLSTWPDEKERADVSATFGNTAFESSTPELNGRPSLLFDGSTAEVRTSQFSPTIQQPLSIVAVVNDEAPSLTARRTVWSGDFAGTRFRFCHGSGTAAQYEFRGDDYIYFDGRVNGPAANVAIFSNDVGNHSAFYNNGNEIAPVGSALAGNWQWDGNHIGNYDDNTVFVGNIAFLGTYVGHIDDDPAWWDLLVWLGEHYGLPVSGPSDFNPETDIAWKALYWASGTKLSALGLGNGAPVTNWPDEMGNAADAIARDTFGNEPTMAKRAINGKPAVRTGLVSGGNYGVASGAAMTYPFSLVLVYQATGNFDLTQPMLAGSETNTFGIEANNGAAGGMRLRSKAGQQGGYIDNNSNVNLWIGQFYENGATSSVLYGAGGQQETMGSVQTNFDDEFVFAALEGDYIMAALYEGQIMDDPEYNEMLLWLKQQYGVSF